MAMRIQLSQSRKEKAMKSQCELCGSFNNLIIHHMQPVALGGNNSSDNLQTLCRPCHYHIHEDLYIPRKPFAVGVKFQSELSKGYIQNTAINVQRLANPYPPNNEYTLQKLGVDVVSVKKKLKQEAHE